MNTFVNPVISPDAKLGVSLFDETDPVRLWQEHSAAEVDIVIRAVYRQVLGNAYVMESERLIVSESQLQRGDIGVREFVRRVAQSDLYRTRFFENCSRLRSIELNFKHLLGRAPESQAEIAEQGRQLEQGGFEAVIDACIDGDEYQSAFGEDTVPYYRGYKTQPGKKIVGFTHMFQLLRGSASSDKDPTHQNRARLNASLMTNRPSAIAPVSGAPSPWQRPATVTDFNQLLRQVLRLQGGIPDGALTPSVTPTAAAAPERQQQFYQAYQPFKETDPVELYPNFSTGDVDMVIRAVYRQVMGNAHIMDSERLTLAESKLKQGDLNVREFVRRLAKSDLYRSRFFDNCYRYRSIELNYKHLLGRAPDSFEEMRYHSTILDQSGFESDIDTYLDSDEYQTAFGESIVPYYRGYRTQSGQSMLEFTNMLQLLRSASSSDQNLATRNQAQLTRAIIQNSPYGKLKVRDVGEILAEVFKPTYLAIAQTQARSTTTTYAAESALRQTLHEQSQMIDRLQQQLIDLRPSAAIGAFYLKSDWQPFAVDGSEEASTPLQGQIEAQVSQIAALQNQIADTRRYAAIGEARLNKWRSRVFNG